MEFNLKKCVVMHFGSNNIKHNYYMLNPNNIPIELTKSCAERDLGVIMSNDLKWDKHIIKCVNNANRVLGQIQHCFRHKSVYITTKLYKALIRPHLEYAVQAWNPFSKKILIYLRASKEKPQNKYLVFANSLILIAAK